MMEKKEKTDIKEYPQEKIEYGKSAFDHYAPHGPRKIIKKGFKLSRTGKIIIILIAVILIIITAYIGLNYFYSYEIVGPGGTTFNPV